MENYSEPENFTNKIIFISMFNDIVDVKSNDEICENISKTIQQHARRFTIAVIGLSEGRGLKRSGAEL